MSNCKEMQVAVVSRLASPANSTMTFGYRVVVVGTTPDAFDEARRRVRSIRASL